MKIRFVTYCNAVTKPFWEDVIDVKEGDNPFDTAVNYLEGIQEGLGDKYRRAYRAYQQDRKNSVQMLYRKDDLILHIVILYETFECLEFEKDLAYKDGVRNMTAMYAETIKELKAQHREKITELKLKYVEKITKLKEKK